MPRTPHARTTLWAAVGLAVLALAYGVDSTIGLISGQVDRSSAVLFSVPLDSAGTVAAILNVIVLIVAAVYARLAVGVLSRRASLREGALFVTGVFGALSTVFAVSGLLATPPAPNRFGALGTAAVNIAVLVLLLHRDTRDDVARAERARYRRVASH